MVDPISAGDTSLHQVLETMQSLLLLVQPNGTIEHVNAAALALLGYKLEELKGQAATKIFPLGEVATLKSPTDWRISAKAKKTELQFAARDGRKIPVILSASPLRRASGELQALVCVAHDLSERKSMEAQLLNAQKLEAIGRLSAGISHEINTPIQFVGDNNRFLQDSFAEIGLVLHLFRKIAETPEGKTPDAKLLEQVRDVRQSTDLDFLEEEIPRAIQQSLDGVGRVSRIVRAMKEFSHPGNETKHAVNLNRLIESTVTVSTNEWKYVSNVELDLDPALPLVPCLPGEFNQVMLNMIINAAHAIEMTAAPGKTVQGEIKISTRQRGDWAEVRIADSGCGIPKEIIDRVFDPFFTTKEVGKGTGQGLSLARAAIVNKHHGKIEIESTVGKGTTFIISLPISPAPERVAGVVHSAAVSAEVQ